MNNTEPKTPILIMVHGLIGSLDYFDPKQRITNAQAYPCDLLGYGTLRDADPSQLTLQQQTSLICRQIEQLDRTSEIWLLGHSMGGAIAMMVADRLPDRIAGLINVEGNFTIKDTFWSRKIASQSLAEWEDEYRTMTADTEDWLKRCGIEPTYRQIEWANQIIANQPASTLWYMSAALVEETDTSHYRDLLTRVANSPSALHLLAGEKSAAAWDVPNDIQQAAFSYTRQPSVGHLMMLEDPERFCRIVDSIILHVHKKARHIGRA